MRITPASTRNCAASRVTKTKSLTKSSVCQHRGELTVLNKIRSPFLMLCCWSSAGLMETLSLISITRAGPSEVSKGNLSMLLPSLIKCFGASIWVPVCTPSEIAELLAPSPRSIERRRSIFIVTSPGQIAIPSLSGTVTSIQLEPVLFIIISQTSLYLLEIIYL